MSCGLCWRPYDGPQIISLEMLGLCGHECEPDEVRPRDRWLEYHGHPPERLQEVLTLLRLASVGAHVGGGKAKTDALVDELAGALEECHPIIECQATKLEFLLKAIEPPEGMAADDQRKRERHLRAERRVANRADRKAGAALTNYAKWKEGDGGLSDST